MRDTATPVLSRHPLQAPREYSPGVLTSTIVAPAFSFSLTLDADALLPLPIAFVSAQAAIAAIAM